MFRGFGLVLKAIKFGAAEKAAKPWGGGGGGGGLPPKGFGYWLAIIY